MSGKPLPACKLQSVALKTLPDAAVPWRRLDGASGAQVQSKGRAGGPQEHPTSPCQIGGGVSEGIE